jgi:hypothetical protein
MRDRAWIAGLVAILALPAPADQLGEGSARWSAVMHRAAPDRTHPLRQAFWVGLRNSGAQPRVLCSEASISLTLASAAGGRTVYPAAMVDHRCSSRWSWHLVAPGETLFSLRAVTVEDGSPPQTVRAHVISEDRASSVGSGTTVKGDASLVLKGPPSDLGAVDDNGSWSAVARLDRSDGKRWYWLGLKNAAAIPRAVCGSLDVVFSVRLGDAELRRGQENASSGCRQEERRLILPGETYYSLFALTLGSADRAADNVVIDYRARRVSAAAEVLPSSVAVQWTDRDLGSRTTPPRTP